MKTNAGADDLAGQSDRAAYDQAPLSIVCLLDGRAGHAAQALGLAEALARRHPETVIETRCVRPKVWAAVLPPAVWQRLGRTLPRWPALALEAPKTLLAPLPGPRARRLVIAAGRRTAPVAAWLARTGGARSVQLMHPQMDLRAFDLVVAPSHDALQAPNAVATTGALGRLTRPAIAAAAKAEAARFTDLPVPRLGVLVGGPSDSARFGEDDATRLIEACLSAAAAGWAPLVTPSRRTPPDLTDRLAKALGRQGWVWNGDGANPYPALLGHTEAVLVTADSVSMASEAAASGLPIHVLALSSLRPKLAAFHREMEAAGIARPYNGTIQRWAYPPLCEADRVAALVTERFFDNGTA